MTLCLLFCQEILLFFNFFTGILLLVFIPYNFSWVIDFTFKEIAAEIRNNQTGTALVNFVAISYMFGYTSSLYHLIYMGTQRLYAVWKPINYRLQRSKIMYISLVLVWILSIVSASTTGLKNAVAYS